MNSDFQTSAVTPAKPVSLNGSTCANGTGFATSLSMRAQCGCDVAIHTRCIKG